MANELDDILMSLDCPCCGQTLTVPYRQIRLYKAAGCSCGILIKIEDTAMIDTAQTPVVDLAEH